MYMLSSSIQLVSVVETVHSSVDEHTHIKKKKKKKKNITSWQKLSVSLGLLIILLSYYTDRSGNCV